MAGTAATPSIQRQVPETCSTTTNYIKKVHMEHIQIFDSKTEFWINNWTLNKLIAA